MCYRLVYCTTADSKQEGCKQEEHKKMMIPEHLRISQMTSAQAAQHITETLQAIPGVWQAQANLADTSVRIVHDEQVSMSTLIQAINRAGYTDVAVLV
jgi:copper chaperone CopZ